MQARSRQFWSRSSPFLRGLLALFAAAPVLWILSGCATTGVSQADPFETRLLSLEQRAMYARANKVQSEQEAIRRANAAFANVQLPEPDYSDGPDVVSTQGKVASTQRKGAPIGRVSAN
jgi:hypothetical protein